MAKMQVIRASIEGERVRADMQENGTTNLTRVINVADKYRNDSRVILQVTTGAGANQMMTITSQVDRLGLPLEDRVVALTSSRTEVYGPFPGAAHNETSGSDKGYTSVAFDNASVEVVAFGL